jgi:hypothetical protein
MFIIWAAPGRASCSAASANMNKSTIKNEFFVNFIFSTLHKKSHKTLSILPIEILKNLCYNIYVR